MRREYKAFGDPYPYKRVGLSRVMRKGRELVLGEVIFSYKTEADRANHMQEENRVGRMQRR